MSTMYVVMNAAGEFLCFPEALRVGSEGQVRPLPPEWCPLDHAARFTSRAAAATVGQDYTILPLYEAWRVAA